MSTKFRNTRIFIPRFADAANNNAQARNAQSIMARWQSEGYRLSTICAGEPEGRVLANPRVDIRRLPDNRYWPAAFFLAYFGSYDCIFYPGTHHYTDWLALKGRALLGRRVPIIATMEALVVAQGDVQAERSISELAGHQVYAYHVPRPQARRYEDILTMADHIIAISPLLAKVAAARYGAEKVSMLPLGVDTELFSNTTPSLHERPRVIGVGQVRGHKRPEMFITLARHFPQADFVWFGEGDMLTDVRRQITRHDCQNIVFPGAVPARALASELAASDVFVLPSLSEGVPKVTQEAAASGLAQIVFGFYEAPTVIDGRNGYVVWSDQELVARLGQLLENRQLTAEMGRAGAQMAQSWSWDVVAGRWERQIVEVMESIAARSARPERIAPAKNAHDGACALDQTPAAPRRGARQDARTKQILVPRAADVMNLNAQAQNAQSILSRWRSTEYRPRTISFAAARREIADNPNVDILRVRDNRLWQLDLFTAYLKQYDGIFYPGIHHFIDWLALRTRAMIGRGVPVIATFELPVTDTSDDIGRENRFAAIAGHPVRCARVSAGELRADDGIFMMADHIIAISPLLARLATREFGPKVSMLPLGVNTATFRRRSSSPRRRPRVICAANVIERKRPTAFVQLARHFPRADFVWYGDGEMRKQILREISRLDMRNVKFPGPIPRDLLASEFAASDILVLPSHAEGVPKITQEAAACGLAQIIFGYYEAPTVIDGRNGFVVWTDEECAARLGELLESGALIRRMGEAGIEMAQSWSWDAIAPRWEQQIIDIMEKRPVRSTAN